MSILTLDPLGSAPGAPCAAPGFRELRGGRRKTSSHLIAWIGVIAALALVATTLPAQAQRGILRKGINRGRPAPSFVPRYPTQSTNGPVNPYY